jgi:hypothetical protein
VLVDFGNFDGDRYAGAEKLMPLAKLMSGKSFDFDSEGNETHTDYRRMFKIAAQAGYRGYVAIEYEGSNLSTRDGVLATKRLLLRVRDELSG